MADALDYAHQRQLLHRDVKPANILLTNQNRARRRILLADFGIARHADDVTGLTATNIAVGSMSYSSPEQLMGHPMDGRADQYSLAAAAFGLFTGAPPFHHSNPAVVISGHLNTPPPRLGDMRPELRTFDAAMAKALSKDPAGRFSTCHDFAVALARAAPAGAAPRPQHPGPAPTPYPGPPVIAHGQQPLPPLQPPPGRSTRAGVAVDTAPAAARPSRVRHASLGPAASQPPQPAHCAHRLPRGGAHRHRRDHRRGHQRLRRRTRRAHHDLGGAVGVAAIHERLTNGVDCLRTRTAQSTGPPMRLPSSARVRMPSLR
jgi:serine/threonine protein kinase, bacterial